MISQHDPRALFGDSGKTGVARAVLRRPAMIRAAAAIVATCVVAFPVDATAQTDAPATKSRTVTLKEALAYAHDHQPQIRAALARVNAQREAAKVPSAQWQPIVGVTAQIYGGTANNTSAFYVTPSFMDIPRIGATPGSSGGSFRPYPSTFVGAGLTQEVFDFGRIAAQRAAADALVDVERHAAEALRLDIDFNVEEAYYAVFAAKGVVSASEEAYARTRAHRDLAKAGVESGMRTPIELTRAEAELARFDIGRIRAHGGLAVAESVLAAAIGSPEAAVEVSGEAPTLGEMPALATAMQRAAARDPRLLQALAELKAQEERTRAIASESRPDISLTATISGRAGGAPPSNGNLPAGEGWIPAVPNYDAGLLFTWAIFDPTVKARTQASRALEEEKREVIESYRVAQIASIKQAYVAVSVARTALPGLERAVQAAHANYAQAEARFKAGMGTSVELADAESLRADAEIQLLAGRFELARARAAFGRAIAEGL
jgi:outer membrane protein TolC